jgi:hypothetical protein
MAVSGAKLKAALNAQSVARRKKELRALPDLIWAPLAAEVLTLIPEQSADPQHLSPRFYNMVAGYLLVGGALMALLIKSL